MVVAAGAVVATGVGVGDAEAEAAPTTSFTFWATTAACRRGAGFPDLEKEGKLYISSESLDKSTQKDNRLYHSMCISYVLACLIYVTHMLCYLLQCFFLLLDHIWNKKKRN